MVSNTGRPAPAPKSRRPTRLLAKAVAVLIGSALLLCTAAFLYFEHSVHPTVFSSSEPSILELGQPFGSGLPNPPAAPGQLAFSPTEFQHPDSSFRPWIRWWWPGDAVDDAEIKAEVARFSATGFGGFEIQSFARGLDVQSPSPNQAAFLGFDTPSYYRHLQVALQSALLHKMQADLTIGSGYPTASPHISAKGNLLTFAYGYREVHGPKTLDWKVTPPVPAVWYKALSVAGQLTKRRMIDFDSADAVALATIAYRVIDHSFQADGLSIGWQPSLDPSSAIDLTVQTSSQGRVIWVCPPGQWVVITFYVMPSGTRPFPGPAMKDPGLVLDFFNPEQVSAMNNYLFGPRTGLPAFFRSPLRAVFADSFELQAERFVVPDILEAFRLQRGYDLKFHLGALPVLGRDNWYLDVAGMKRHPAFVLNDEDERIRYDYDLTISELFINRYIGTSRKWANGHGVKQRVQPYGLNINIVKAAGLSDIPETEVLYAGGTEMFLKLVSSGAHLYDRNLISAEAFDHPGIGVAMTLPSLKAEADRLFLAGVNQIVFHGSPYDLNVHGTENSKWYPFRASNPTFNVSTNFAQGSELWDKLKPFNDYITRCQYLLRLRTPKADVLIYYPFLGFPNDYATLSHHEEFGFNGLTADVRPPVKHSLIPAVLSPLFAAQDLDKVLWLDTIWPTLRELDSRGITWDWITDAELETATSCNKKICVGKNSYSSLALIQTRSLPAPSAIHLHRLALDGSHIHLIGSTPSQPTGYKDFRQGDRIVKEEMQATQAIAKESLPEAIGNVERDANNFEFLRISFTNPNIRRIDRTLQNDSTLTFLVNQSNVEAEIVLGSVPPHRHWMCLDAATGDLQQLNKRNVPEPTIRLSAYQSMFIIGGR